VLPAQVAETAAALRRDPVGSNAIDELDNAVGEMTTMIGFYERVPTEHHISLAY
jgi:hypothetical protein